MSKATFIQTIESLFESNEVSTEVREYFEQTVKAKKVNKKEQEKSKIVKQAIHDFLKANSGKAFNRNEIGDALWNNADIDEKHLVNDKGDGVAYNSITAYANQLVTLGLVLKAEQKVGKAKKIVYTSR
jgi:uncharacterized protein YwbE